MLFNIQEPRLTASEDIISLQISLNTCPMSYPYPKFGWPKCKPKLTFQLAMLSDRLVSSTSLTSNFIRFMLYALCTDQILTGTREDDRFYRSGLGKFHPVTVLDVAL